MHGEERDRRVTPIIDQPGRSILRIELKDRHQFDCSDAEFLQIRNFLDETCVRALLVFVDTGAAMTRKTAHVHLVYDRPGGGALERRVTFPIVGGWIHTTLFMALAVLSPSIRAAFRL
jgi:hypothetical protein